jgi:hypothetical protein
MRRALAVIAGYLVFAVPSGALFQVSGRNPHAPQPLSFVVLSIVYGIVAAILGGYLAAVLAGGRPGPTARAVGIVIAAVAIVSIAARPGAVPAWSQIAAIILIAPSTLLGGWLRSAQLAARASRDR